MTDVATSTEDPPVHLELSHGMSDRKYVEFAFVLAGITALEVAWSYFPFWDGAHGAKKLLEVGGLLFMMMLKFIGIAGRFMHLKYDSPILSRIFYAGLVLAAIVYFIVLTTFHVWSA